jgi:hypothetical protein
MKMRRTLLCGAVLVSALAGPAGAAAAKKPTCNLVVDAADDASWPGGAPASLDIVSGDIASDGKDITAVIRVKKYTDPDTSAGVGRKWVMTFKAPGQPVPLYLMAINDPVLLAPTYDFGTVRTDLVGQRTFQRGGGAKGTLDAARNEIRIHLPNGDFNKYDVALGMRTTLSELTTEAFVMANNYNSYYDFSTDTAASKKTYAVGRASCVKVGL